MGGVKEIECQKQDKYRLKSCKCLCFFYELVNVGRPQWSVIFCRLTHLRGGETADGGSDSRCVPIGKTGPPRKGSLRRKRPAVSSVVGTALDIIIRCFCDV